MEFKYHRSKSVQSNTRYKTKESIDTIIIDKINLMESEHQIKIDAYGKEISN